MCPILPSEPQQAIVLGGGFYGICIALYLSKRYKLKKVVVVEQEKEIMTRASYVNQARVHQGYHYPRNFTTAHRSRINAPKFLRDWPGAVVQDFTKLYAIPRHASKINAQQFKRFCLQIGAPIEAAPTHLKKLFSARTIEEVFCVEEHAFNSQKLAIWATKELQTSGIKLLLETHAQKVLPTSTPFTKVILQQKNQEEVFSLLTSWVFNCTYSGLNRIEGLSNEGLLKHELAEMPLLGLPPQLQKLGITVMDGSFFSLMPFPSLGQHTLSHVRYTPHTYWMDQQSMDPYKKLENYHRTSRFERMLRDAQRYLPAISQASYSRSLFEIKTILRLNETNDGRPILFRKHENFPACYSILGGKIDNIYDILEKLEQELSQDQIQRQIA